MKKCLIIFLFFFPFFSYSQNWQQFSNGLLAGSSLCIDPIQNRLCLIAKIIDLHGDTIITPACWNGSSWNRLGIIDFANSGGVSKLYFSDSTFYVGGSFSKLDSLPGDRILKLVNNSWDSLSFSPNNSVYSFCDFNGALVIGGRFSSFGPMITNGLIANNNQFWSTFPPFAFSPVILTLKQFNNALIIAGAYQSDLTLSYKGNIAAWNGINMIPMENGLEIIDPFSYVNDLEVYNGQLFAAGPFNAVNITNGRGVVQWNGFNFSNVNGSLNNDAFALQEFNGALYVAGGFTLAGNIPSDHIAKWDGNKWCSLGSDFNGPIIDMCVFNNELIVLGTFTEIDGQPVNKIARWIGGNYVDSCSMPLSIDNSDLQSLVTIHPNPASKLVTISQSGYFFYRLTVFDMLGKHVHHEDIASPNSEIDVSMLNPGIYFLLLEGKSGHVVKKLIRQ